MASLFAKKPKIARTGDIARESFNSTVNQVGPGFATSFGVDDDGNRFQRFSETGDQAALTQGRVDIARALSSRGLATAGNLGGRDAVEQSLTDDLAGGRDAFEQATFDRALSLLSPELERQERSVRSSLVNTGNPIGTERANYELDRLNRNRSTLLNDTALASVLAGLQGQGQQIANLNAYSGGRDAAAASDLGQVGNIFSIMQADRPQYFAPGQLLSPETILNRSLGKASVKQQRNAGIDSLIGGALSAGGQIGSAMFMPRPALPGGA